MPKRIIRRLMPDPHQIRNHKYLQFLGSHLHSPNLWHINRRSVGRAFAVGLFAAFVPVPMQMAIAGAIAIVVEAYLPVSIALVWITNPVTIPPVFYACYRLGAWLLGMEAVGGRTLFTSGKFFDALGQIWQPLILGSLVTGLTLAAAFYFGTRTAWRALVMHKWNRRRERRRAAAYYAAVVKESGIDLDPPAGSGG